MDIRNVNSDDLAWLSANDRHVSQQWIERCIQLNEYRVATLQNGPIGFIRFSWFWGAVPFLDMIFVEVDQRGQGIGRALFTSWQASMSECGARTLLTSSMSDEGEPQTWHERNGFRLAGSVSFGRFQTTPEIFFVKDL